MHVTLGLTLDNHLGPSNRDTLGEPVLGRIGLLGLLETYLGLSRPEVTVAHRITSYLGHLRKHTELPCFYARSLETDSVGTSAKLLAWRDEWRLGGWDGTVPAGGPKRLLDMARVEQTAMGNIPPGEAERLSAILASLATERTPIESVQLVDPLDSFPWAWRQVLACLPNVTHRQPEPQGRGQLRQLQEYSAHALRTGQLLALENPITDGSVVLVQASSRETAEHWLSASCRHAAVDRLLVCESDGDSLDVTMMATGHVGSGFQNASALRPALQALGLALEMCWAPLDVGLLVEFLSHPVGPFSRKVRASLAKAVAEQPGIGGEAWEAVKQTISDNDDDAPVLDDIVFWLEGERWAREEGAPIDTLLARVDRLSVAFKKHLTSDQTLHAVFLPAIEQCGAVKDGLLELQAQAVTRLTPRQIEQLILHATPAGATNPDALAQVGCIRAESSAAACIEAADEVIWWMPSTPQLPQPLPWSKAELDVLQTLGVELRNPQQELDLLAKHWLRPILAAKQRFVMVLPPPGTEEHPFRQLLLKLAPDLMRDYVDLDAQLGRGFVGTLSENLTPIALPHAPDIIELEAPLKLPANSQSYTSLVELFDAPALYVFKRVARLRPTSILEAEEGNRLLGTLAHRVFDMLFKQAGSLTWSEEQASAWFQRNIGSLLETEGALLLMQGAGVSQQRFKVICERAICSMLRYLRAAGARGVRTELALEGMLGDIHLIGKVDLLVDLPDGRVVALDMKWRRENDYAKSLQEGTYLQLALYSLLYEQKMCSTPAALGYFIFETGVMFVTEPDLIPTAQIRTPPTGATANLLEQAKASWKWRAEQWEKGQIEVVPIGGSNDFQGPEGTLPVGGPKAWDKDYLVLLGGWEQ